MLLRDHPLVSVPIGPPPDTDTASGRLEKAFLSSNLSDAGTAGAEGVHLGYLKRSGNQLVGCKNDWSTDRGNGQFAKHWCVARRHALCAEAAWRVFITSSSFHNAANMSYILRYQDLIL